MKEERQGCGAVSFFKSKIGNDQKLVQSDPISCLQNQKGKRYIHKLTVHERHTVNGMNSPCPDRPRGYKVIFMLNSAERDESFPAHLC